MRRRNAALAALPLFSPLLGRSAIGYAIGTGVDREPVYADARPVDLEAVDVGERVQVDHAKGQARGRLSANCVQSISIDGDDDLRVDIPIAEVDAVATVPTRPGSARWTLFGLGLAVDIAATIGGFVGLGVLLSNPNH